MIQLLSKDGQASQHRQRFIAFRQPAGQVNKMGRKIALPALPYSRLTALRSLLSVALSSARLLDSITLAFFHTKWSRFQFQNGPVFDFNFNLVSYQLGSFSLLKWARFHLQKTILLISGKLISKFQLCLRSLSSICTVVEFKEI